MDLNKGRVALTKFWQKNQNVKTGETLMTVVPEEDGEHSGKIFLSQQGAGKVKTGQKVNIKLDDYPHIEDRKKCFLSKIQPIFFITLFVESIVFC